MTSPYVLEAARRAKIGHTTAHLEHVEEARRLLQSATRWAMDASRQRYTECVQNALFYAEQDLSKALAEISKARAAVTKARLAEIRERGSWEPGEVISLVTDGWYASGTSDVEPK